MFQFIPLQPKVHTVVLSSLNSIPLFSLLDLDTRQNMHNQNKVVFRHYKAGASVLFSKIYFYDHEILACYYFY